VTERPTIGGDRPAASGTGRLIAVVGPSGAGKDSLINLARRACAGDGTTVFPRRVVTREASRFEDNTQVSMAAFRQARDRGDFAAHWEAHGHGYALPSAIDDELAAGRTVVANVSRTVVEALRRAYADVTVVLITAPPDILAERLAARERGSDGEIAHRLGRAVDDVRADVAIVNLGNIEHRAREFVEVIRA
jgi:ribose 1,5-bisphosphokinase